MNNEHIKSGINQAKGRIKEEVGHLTGNNTLEGEGIIERVIGKVQETVGHAKDSAKKLIDTALDHDSKK
jgi:uncharacterized protein YjbJ (UPF0337 family)